jgi:Protein of unknown function (DUF3433)
MQVMAVIAALWAKVDYRSKQMAPWHAMAKRPQSVENSLLLDYISPFFLWSIFSSLHRSHWAVAAAILGTMLVKGLYILSTALFILQPLKAVHHVLLSASDRFGGDRFNSSSVDDTPVLDWAGVLLHAVDYGPGVTSQYAVQSFNSSHAIQGMCLTPLRINFPVPDEYLPDATRN